MRNLDDPREMLAFIRGAGEPFIVGQTKLQKWTGHRNSQLWSTPDLSVDSGLVIWAIRALGLDSIGVVFRGMCTSRQVWFEDGLSTPVALLIPPRQTLHFQTTSPGSSPPTDEVVFLGWRTE